MPKYRSKIVTSHSHTAPVARSATVTAVPHSSWKGSNTMATPAQDRKLRDPALNPGDQPYFDACAEGKLLIKKCKDCGKVHHYPRGICPHCFSLDVEWMQTIGTGE